MIAKLRGILDTVGEDFAILDVNGVGYLVHGSRRTLSSLPAVGDAVMLHIETVVREDAITLFAFIDVLERDMFRLLTSVQGVGAKVGLAVLSTLAPNELQNAIAAQDKVAVARTKGVGPKVASRIVLELKDKVTGLVFQPKGVQMPAGSTSGPSENDGDVADAISALVNLGYRATEAHAAVAKAVTDAGEDADVGVLVPAALKLLSKV